MVVRRLASVAMGGETQRRQKGSTPNATEIEVNRCLYHSILLIADDILVLSHELSALRLRQEIQSHFGCVKFQ